MPGWVVLASCPRLSAAYPTSASLSLYRRAIIAVISVLVALRRGGLSSEYGSAEGRVVDEAGFSWTVIKTWSRSGKLSVSVSVCSDTSVMTEFIDIYGWVIFVVLA